MTLRPGAKMIRVSDGMRGVVEHVVESTAMHTPAPLRIVYQDRGERMVATSREKWVEEEGPSGKLREEEIERVALSADRELRSIVKHEPVRFWEPLHPEPFDAGLVKVIREYLGSRAG